MHLKTLSFGLAVALASTVTLAAPVDYKIDPTHTVENIAFLDTKRIATSKKAEPGVTESTQSGRRHCRMRFSVSAM